MELMNNAKMTAIERNMTGIMRKVLDAVPIAEPWTIPQICSEIQRAGGTSDRRAISGCLNTLVEYGLIREPVAGSFERKPHKPATPPATTESAAAKGADVMTMPQKSGEATSVPPLSPLDRLAAAGHDLRELSRSISRQSKNVEQLAEEIDAVAIEVTEKISRIESDTAKMRQLQELLKSIGQ